MLLEKINSPSDIKGFNYDELRVLCKEIREYIVECCSRNPGHLASSLGAVELIVGLHYLYNTPEDKIVFDVGHQAYAHKIITGRKEEFKNNRTREGISGFPRIAESEYDAFGAGHSSTSISAALGLAEAGRILNRKEKVVALIEGTTRVANYDTTITDIVKEDCEAYFSGQKSAEDVAKLIQSKVNIYVNEQR